jgi:hypothetical protein
MGGWKWKEERASFDGKSLDDLRQKVEDYRESNGLPIGDVSGDFAKAWAETSPWTVCHAEELEPDDKAMLAAEAREWLMALWKKPPAKLLGRKEAEPRYAKCLSCEFNQKLGKDVQGAEDLNRRAILLTRGLELPKELGCCSVHGWHNRAAVLLPAKTCDEWPQ